MVGFFMLLVIMCIWLIPLSLLSSNTYLLVLKESKLFNIFLLYTEYLKRTSIIKFKDTEIICITIDEWTCVSNLLKIPFMHVYVLQRYFIIDPICFDGKQRRFYKHMPLAHSNKPNF